MPVFNIKNVDTTLFGVVEAANQDTWLETFARPSETRVEVGVDALDLIAEELALDAEGLAFDAERYVGGKYRAKARGMGGGRLGDFGEVIAFLMNRCSGREILRVVSWRRGPEQPIKDSRFPQPDYLVRDAETLRALEVKSTEAFDFIELRDTTKRWTWLQPCKAVSKCRTEALPQLGYINDAFVPQQHSLRIRSGECVPFPVANGEALAVLTVDGRIGSLRGDERYKTPKRCRQARRTCWACVDEQHGIVAVRMPNSPGHLSLAGLRGFAPTEWFDAYRRWGQALSALDVEAIASAMGQLGEYTSAWCSELDDRDSEAVLRAFWGSYLTDATRSRGISLPAPEGLGQLNEAGFEWTPAPLAGPLVQLVPIAEFAEAIGQRRALSHIRLSSKRGGEDAEGGSFSLASSDYDITIKYVSKNWWNHRPIETTEAASKIAAELVDTVLRLSGPQVIREFDDGAGSGLPLRAVDAQVGDTSVPLGWVSKPAPRRSRVWPQMLRRSLGLFEPDLPPSWPALLLLGDPRVRLQVLPDGRARLRIARSVWLERD